MACNGCINRQRKLVTILCRKPDSRLCKKAQERLAKMEAKQQETKA